MEFSAPKLLDYRLDISIIPPLEKEKDGGKFHKDTRKLLASLLTGAETVLELGAFIGNSTRFIAERARHVYTVDHFEGPREHDKTRLNEKYPHGLYHAFVQNIPLALRKKITIYCGNTLLGMKRYYAIGIRPDLVFIDASHEYEDVCADLTLALELFPAAQIAMDDFCWLNPNEEDLPTVQQAVVDVCRDRGISWQQRGHACVIPFTSKGLETAVRK